jgi:DNA-binding PadR family transcriptional regulator
MSTIRADLEQEGLVERSPHPTDGRQILFSLTDQGVEARQKRSTAKHEWLLTAVAKLRPAERQTLLSAAGIIRGLSGSRRASEPRIKEITNEGRIEQENHRTPETERLTMNWLHEISYFLGGAFLANAVPHFVSGMMGRPFLSPFAKPPGKGLSSSTVNVLWGFANFVIAYLLIAQVGDFDIHVAGNVIAAGIGVLLLGVFSARSSSPGTPRATIGSIPPFGGSPPSRCSEVSSHNSTQRSSTSRCRAWRRTCTPALLRSSRSRAATFWRSPWFCR